MIMNCKKIYKKMKMINNKILIKKLTKKIK